MKISRINAQNAGVSFGYSKKSQAYIEKVSKTTANKRYGADILALSNLCNSMEENIKHDERRMKSYDEEEEFSSHMDMFLALKNAILESVIGIFPDCEEYLESEKSYYENSFKHCKDNLRDNYREAYLDVINGWVCPKASVDMSLKKDNSDIKDISKAESSSETEPETKKEKTKTEKSQEAKKQSLSEAASALLFKSKPENVMVEVLLPKEGSPKGFKDVMGMDELKAELKDGIIEAVNNPKQAELDFKEYGKKSPTGVLLYGPPGCGKTYIVEALANEIDTVVYTLDIGKAGSKYINQTSKNIKASFDYVKLAAKEQKKPIILFMDEMDSMTMKRSGGADNDENLKQVATLLKSIEDIQKNNVIVVGATNRFDLVDPAIRRRFSVKRFVGAPVKKQVKEQVKNNLSSKEKAKKLLEDEDTLDKVSDLLTGYSYHSINIISNEASINALKRNRADIGYEDFEKAIKDTNEEKVKEEDYKTRQKAHIGFGT